MADCCDPIVPPRNCKQRCNPLVSADCVIDPSGYDCLGIEPESTQSQINAAVIQALCDMDPTSLCPVFTDIDMASGWFTTSGGQDIAASDPIGCIVRLHGLAEKEFSYFEGDAGCHKYQLTITNTALPSNQRPTFAKLLSLNVIVRETNNPSTNTQHIFPAQLVVLTNGQMTISFYIDRCLSSGNSPYKIVMSLDGLTYETN